MKAISLWQPYASLWAAQIKRFETRSWALSYRGPLAIHAAKRQDHDTLAYFLDNLTARAAVKELGIARLADLPWGAVVAVCERVICRRTGDIGRPSLGVTALTERERALGDFSANRWYWEPAGMRLLPEPIAARGSQGLWDWEPPAELREWLHRLGVRL